MRAGRSTLGLAPWVRAWFVGLSPSASRGKRSSTRGLEVWAVAEGSVLAQGEQRAPRTVDGSSPMRLAVGPASVSH